jgi:hypothetical protein
MPYVQRVVYDYTSVEYYCPRFAKFFVQGRVARLFLIQYTKMGEM